MNTEVHIMLPAFFLARTQKYYGAGVYRMSSIHYESLPFPPPRHPPIHPHASYRMHRSSYFVLGRKLQLRNFKQEARSFVRRRNKNGVEEGRGSGMMGGSGGQTGPVICFKEKCSLFICDKWCEYEWWAPGAPMGPPEEGRERESLFLTITPG